MKDTGIIRKVDDLGRIVIPKELRNKLEIKEGDPIEIWTDESAVVLKKYVSNRKCCFCGKLLDSKHATYLGKQICFECVQNIKQEQ